MIITDEMKELLIPLEIGFDSTNPEHVMKLRMLQHMEISRLRKLHQERIEREKTDGREGSPETS